MPQVANHGFGTSESMCEDSKAHGECPSDTVKKECDTQTCWPVYCASTAAHTSVEEIPDRCVNCPIPEGRCPSK